MNGRLYRQLGKLLDDMEAADRDDRMTMPQRVSALIAVARVQIMFNTIRKGEISDGTEGSAVRRYSQAFAKKADGIGPRASGARSEFGGFNSGTGDDDDPDAA